MTQRIFITGIGSISAIGNDTNEALSSLIKGKTGIGALSNILTRLSHLPVGEVKHKTSELLVLAGLSSSQTPYSRTDLLGIIAAKEAVKSAKLDSAIKVKTGLISATTVGGMADTELNWGAYRDILNNGKELSQIQTHEAAYSTEKIADVLGIKDYLGTISTACSSASNAILLGARLIKSGILDRAVVGGTDALSKFTLNGFNTLMILDDELCKPFDARRKGLNLGEGAGYLVLESEEVCTGKDVLCELIGYANTNDAFHQTASSPDGDGAFLAMQQTLKMGKIEPRNVSYINAHGTGTHVNDLSEGRAIERLFASVVPPVSSTKTLTGHTLGACGGIEAVFSVLAIKESLIYPNLNFTSTMEELSFLPNLALINNKKVEYVLSNSFGFGGNTTALLFGRI